MMGKDTRRHNVDFMVHFYPLIGQEWYVAISLADETDLGVYKQ